MKRSEGRLVPGLVVLFFLSGAAGLGYQVLWAKAFGAGVGHEYPATLAVITAFMSGMAIGGLVFERLPRRIQAAPQAYGILELIIGLWGAGTVALTPFLNRSVVHLLGQDPSFAWHWSVVFSAVFLALLPATLAMGATLPAVERLIFSLRGQASTGLLYGANTGGAIFGSMLSAFWLMPKFGISHSIFIFAGLNLFCGVASLFLVRRPQISFPERTANASPELALALRLFFSGLLGIAFETIMVRGLSHILENTVYTFAGLLAVYFLGTALGATAYHKLGYGRVRLEHVFAGVALSCLLSGLILRWILPFYPNLRAHSGDSLWAVSTSEIIIAALVFLLPSFGMGALFTALSESSLKSRRSLGWSVALNSFGSAAAPAIFGLIVIPHFGLKVALAVVLAGYAALAGRSALWMVPAALLVSPVLTGSRDLIARQGQTIPFFRDGVMASVAVLQDTNHSRVLKVNNRFQMGGTSARLAEQRHADIPLLLHPDPRRALFIGLGTGITFSTAAQFPRVAADGVELLSEVVEAMPLFQEDPDTLANPNLQVHIADGRRFVLTTTNRYDVVVGDLFHPAQDGAGFLFTREHFAAVRNCLQDGGLFCQWLPLYQLDLPTTDVIASTFREIFPEAEMWLLRFNVDTPVVGLIGWKNRNAVSPGLVESKVRLSDTLHDHLRSTGLGDTLRLFGCRLGPVPPSTSSLVNTDQNPLVIFRAPYRSFQRHDDPGARLLQLIEKFPIEPPLWLASDQSFKDSYTRYVRARNIYLRGLVEESGGNVVRAVSQYIESARISPDFTSGYAQALGIATTLARTNPETAEAILRQLMEAQPDRPVARQLLERLKVQR